MGEKYYILYILQLDLYIRRVLLLSYFHSSQMM